MDIQRRITAGTAARGAVLGAASGAVGGAVAGLGMAALLAPRLGKQALVAPLVMAAQFALYGIAVGAVGELVHTPHPERSPMDRALHGAAVPAVAGTLVLGTINAVVAASLFRNGAVSGREAITLAVAGVAVGAAASAIAGSTWGMLHD